MSSLAITNSTDIGAFIGTQGGTSIRIEDDRQPLAKYGNGTVHIKIKDASELLEPVKNSTLESYINKNLTWYSVGLAISVVALAYFIISGALGAIVITSITALAFLDMVVTVSVDKRTSAK